SPQRVYALAMRPNVQLAELVEGEPAGRRDRGVSEVAPRVGSFEAFPPLGICRRSPECAIDSGPLQQPAGFLLRRDGCLDVVPDHMTAGRTSCPIDRSS